MGMKKIVRLYMRALMEPRDDAGGASEWTKNIGGSAMRGMGPGIQRMTQEKTNLKRSSASTVCFVC